MATASLGKEALGREFGAMRPNILLITADQWRGDSYGAAGHPVVRTPAIDALAAEGVCFLRHFSQAAPCSPGRARSDERRVGEECVRTCRSRWSPCHLKKKKIINHK